MLAMQSIYVIIIMWKCNSMHQECYKYKSKIMQRNIIGRLQNL